MRPNPRWQQQGVRGQGGFQAVPNSLRQPGPRANIRHIAPNANAQGPRAMPTGAQRGGERTPLTTCSYCEHGPWSFAYNVVNQEGLELNSFVLLYSWQRSAHGGTPWTWGNYTTCHATLQIRHRGAQHPASSSPTHHLTTGTLVQNLETNALMLQ